MSSPRSRALLPHEDPNADIDLWESLGAKEQHQSKTKPSDALSSILQRQNKMMKGKGKGHSQGDDSSLSDHIQTHLSNLPTAPEPGEGQVHSRVGRHLNRIQLGQEYIFSLAWAAREDIHCGLKFLVFRERFFWEVITELKGTPNGKNLSRKQLDSFRYELVNIYSRFYMSARNEAIPYLRSWRKMIGELEEKKLPATETLLLMEKQLIDGAKNHSATQKAAKKAQNDSIMSQGISSAGGHTRLSINVSTLPEEDPSSKKPAWVVPKNDPAETADSPLDDVDDEKLSLEYGLKNSIDLTLKIITDRQSHLSNNLGSNGGPLSSGLLRLAEQSLDPKSEKYAEIDRACDCVAKGKDFFAGGEGEVKSDEAEQHAEQQPVQTKPFPLADLVIESSKNNFIEFKIAGSGGEFFSPKMAMSVDQPKRDKLLNIATNHISHLRNPPTSYSTKLTLDKNDYGASPEFEERLANHKRIARQHAEFILMITVLSYVPASGSLYWGFGPGVYKFVMERLNGCLEAYASPFNHSLPSFCSPFWLDKTFRSCASFYDFFGSGGEWRTKGSSWNELGLPPPEDRFTSNDWSLSKKYNKGGGEEVENLITLVANPPYIEADLELCAKTIGEALSSFIEDSMIRWDDGNASTKTQKKKRLLILSICPNWAGAKGIVAMQNTGFKAFEKILPPGDHGYYNYQTGKFIKATFPSLAFAYYLELNKGTQTHPPTVSEASGKLSKKLLDRVEMLFDCMGKTEVEVDVHAGSLLDKSINEGADQGVDKGLKRSGSPGGYRKRSLSNKSDDEVKRRKVSANASGKVDEVKEDDKKEDGKKSEGAAGSSLPSGWGGPARTTSASSDDKRQMFKKAW